MSERPIPQPAAERLRSWNISARSWYATHYTVGLFAMALTIIVASKPGALKTNTTAIEYIACAAAILQGLNTFLGSTKKARSYRAAWRHLRRACIDYQLDPKTPDSSISEAIQKGWETIVDIEEHTK